MEDNDYVKLTLMDIGGKDSVEVDVLASKESLTSMIFSAMCNNKFFGDSVISATQEYFLYVIDHDSRAKLN
jgi:hypothetical protein